MNDLIYQNTRRFVWSEDNPCFFRGKAGEGIGGPHIGYDMPWPMSIMMKCFTAQSDDEIRWCMKTLLNTDAGMGFIHESFHKDDASKYTRASMRSARIRHRDNPNPAPGTKESTL